MQHCHTTTEVEMHRNTNLKKKVFSYAIYSKFIQDKYLNGLNDFILEKQKYIYFFLEKNFVNIFPANKFAVFFTKYLTKSFQ